MKRLFVQRRAVKGMTAEAAAALDGPALAPALEPLLGEPLTEARFADAVDRWLERRGRATHEALDARRALRRLGDACAGGARSTIAPACCSRCRTRLDMHHLVPVETVVEHGVTMLRLPPASSPPCARASR